MPKKNDARADGALVSLRITKFGEGRVSTGRHQAGGGDDFFAAGTVTQLPRPIAEALEARGFGEIQTQ
jgi:hypothetical protein